MAQLSLPFDMGPPCPISHFHRPPCLWIAGVVKEKSKNYHNWTSSAFYDVLPAVCSFIMSASDLSCRKWMPVGGGIG